MQLPTNCIQIDTCFFILQKRYHPIILLDFITTSITFLTPTYNTCIPITNADRNRLTSKEIDKIWTMKDDKYYQIVLMLIYNGVRISNLLDLKKENVHLDNQYFDVIDSKIENGIRKVSIADKVLDFYKNLYNDNIE